MTLSPFGKFLRIPHAVIRGIENRSLASGYSKTAPTWPLDITVSKVPIDLKAALCAFVNHMARDDLLLVPKVTALADNQKAITAIIAGQLSVPIHPHTM